jgi:rhodanese-related sulfurtransferase
MSLIKTAGLLLIGGIVSLLIIASQQRGAGLQNLPKLMAGKDHAPPSVYEAEVVDLAETLSLFYSKGSLFVDIREPKYYQHNHVLGAVNIPIGLSPEAFSHDLLQLGSEKTTLIIYCNDYHCPAVFAAAERAVKLKTFQVKIYVRGFGEWMSLHLPTSAPPDEN